MAKKRRRDKGRPFRPGHDPRRHKFTRAEQRKGYRNAYWACALSWEKFAWLYRKIRGYYRAAARERRNSGGAG